MRRYSQLPNLTQKGREEDVAIQKSQAESHDWGKSNNNNKKKNKDKFKESLENSSFWSPLHALTARSPWQLLPSVWYPPGSSSVIYQAILSSASTEIERVLPQVPSSFLRKSKPIRRSELFQMQVWRNRHTVKVLFWAFPLALLMLCQLGKHFQMKNIFS